MSRPRVLPRVEYGPQKPQKVKLELYTFRDVMRYVEVKYGLETTEVLSWLEGTDAHPKGSACIWLPLFEAENSDVPAHIQAVLAMVKRDFADDQDTLQLFML